MAGQTEPVNPCRRFCVIAVYARHTGDVRPPVSLGPVCLRAAEAAVEPDALVDGDGFGVGPRRHPHLVSRERRTDACAYGLLRGCPGKPVGGIRTGRLHIDNLATG